MTASWEETTFPTILSSYALRNLYNAHEFGLFYKALPEKSLQLQSEKYVGGKHNKVRVIKLLHSLKFALNLTIYYRKEKKKYMYIVTSKIFKTKLQKTTTEINCLQDLYGNSGYVQKEIQYFYTKCECLIKRRNELRESHIIR